jgi:hypothetical protein
VFEIMIALQESQNGFTYEEIEARLESRDKALLEAAAFADEANEGSTPMEVAHACLRTLELEDRETQRATLRARIRDAERNGDHATALRLYEELLHLDRG